ncbi:MAG: hypothetical protein NC236_01005 [Mycoplasma sp.]|nr:hypothetical protein [Mycoplasma sp.]
MKMKIITGFLGSVVITGTVATVASCGSTSIQNEDENTSSTLSTKSDTSNTQTDDVQSKQPVTTSSSNNHDQKQTISTLSNSEKEIEINLDNYDISPTLEDINNFKNEESNWIYEASKIRFDTPLSNCDINSILANVNQNNYEKYDQYATQNEELNFFMKFRRGFAINNEFKNENENLALITGDEIKPDHYWVSQSSQSNTPDERKQSWENGDNSIKIRNLNNWVSKNPINDEPSKDQIDQIINLVYKNEDQVLGTLRRISLRDVFPIIYNYFKEHENENKPLIVTIPLIKNQILTLGLPVINIIVETRQHLTQYGIKNLERAIYVTENGVKRLLGILPYKSPIFYNQIAEN